MELGTPARPWRRFWARWLDLILFTAVLAGACRLLGITWEAEGLFAMSACALWVPVEAALLSTWGTTPFKAALGLRVRRSDGAKVTLVQAFFRSLQVWVLGTGLGVPVLGVITAIVSYRQLQEKGSTIWDRRAWTVVVRGEPSSVLP